MLVEILKILFDGLCVGLASSVTVGPVAVLCIQRTLSKGHLSGIMSGMGIAVADTLMAILAFTVYALIKSSIDEYNTAIQICGGIFVVIVGIFIFFKNPVPQIRKNRSGKSHLWQDFVSMFGFTMANFVVIIPYILAFFTMFNMDLSDSATTNNVEANIEAVSADDNIENEGDNIAYIEPEEFNAENSLVEATTVANNDIATMVEQPNEGITATDQQSADTAPATKPIKRMLYNTIVMAGFFIGATLWWIGLTSLINLFRRGFRPRHMLTINHAAGIIISALGVYTLISVIFS